MNMHSTDCWEEAHIYCSAVRRELKCSRKLSTNFKNNYIAHRWIRAFLAPSRSSEFGTNANRPKEPSCHQPTNHARQVGGWWKNANVAHNKRQTVSRLLIVLSSVFLFAVSTEGVTRKKKEEDEKKPKPKPNLLSMQLARCRFLAGGGGGAVGWSVYRVSEFMFAIVLFLFVCTEFCMPPAAAKPPTHCRSKKNSKKKIPCQMTNVGKKGHWLGVGGMQNCFGALMMVRNCHPTESSTNGEGLMQFTVD